MLHAQEHAEHVGIEGGGVTLRGLFGDRAGRALGAGVIDGNVEAAGLRDDRATRFCTSFSWRTSARMNSASAPSARSSLTSALPASSRRPETTIRAPSFAQ